MIPRYRSILSAFALAAVTTAPAVAQRGVGDRLESLVIDDDVDFFLRHAMVFPLTNESGAWHE